MIFWPLFRKQKKKREHKVDGMSKFLPDTDFLPTEFHQQKEDLWLATQPRQEALSLVPVDATKLPVSVQDNQPGPAPYATEADKPSNNPNNQDAAPILSFDLSMVPKTAHLVSANDPVIPVLTEILIPKEDILDAGLDLDLDAGMDFEAAYAVDDIPVLEEALSDDETVSDAPIPASDVAAESVTGELADALPEADRTTLVIDETTDNGFIFGQIVSEQDKASVPDKTEQADAQAAALETQLTLLLDETINDVVSRVLQQQLRIATVNLKVQIRDELLRRLRERNQQGLTDIQLDQHGEPIAHQASQMVQDETAKSNQTK